MRITTHHPKIPAFQSSSSSSLYRGKTFSQFLAGLKANASKAADSKPRKPQSFRDGLIRARVHYKRNCFIASIRDEDICHFASIQHNRNSCILFKSFVRNSYNVCYFIEFANSDRWVIQVPLAPTLALDATDKLESEVAAIQLVATRTTIPIPQIHTYALGDSPAPFPSFLILEYTEGRKLNYIEFKELAAEQRDRLDTSLADIYIQLRHLEFPSIGRLVQGPEGVQIGKRVVTLDINMQELENVAPSKVMDSSYSDSGTLLQSADRYREMLLDLADNVFCKGHGTVSNEEGAEDYLTTSTSSASTPSVG
ncbi:hypothetical protein MFIFM68171_02116 [Madurella fahalii]|uniref:Aminoglycoside phosphotransferase domain-containing protein n=1 Tax=Madurella fahalii TaxID=1157608 RepID=A0ABQ0G2E8_9PEZI